MTRWHCECATTEGPLSHIIWTFVIINLYKSLKGEARERKKHVQHKEAYQSFMISRSGSVQPDDDIYVILVHLQWKIQRSSHIDIQGESGLLAFIHWIFIWVSQKWSYLTVLITLSCADINYVYSEYIWKFVNGEKQGYMRNYFCFYYIEQAFFIINYNCASLWLTLLVQFIFSLEKYEVEIHELSPNGNGFCDTRGQKQHCKEVGSEQVRTGVKAKM